MNRGLLIKSFREIAPITVGFGLLLLVVKTVISFVLPSYENELYAMILKMQFFRTLLGALLGTPLTEDVGSQVLYAIPWVHPLVLLIVFAHETTVTTRLPVGEIDRGTIDLLLGLPVSRWQTYLCHSLVWSVSGAVIIVVGLAGNMLGIALANASIIALPRLLLVVLNGYCLYLAIGSLGFFVSSLSDRRGRAVGAVLAFVTISFLINFLAEFWAPARAIDFLSLLSYYRPFTIFERGVWPFGDLAVLLAAGAVFWIAGAIVYRRRDIYTL